MAILIIEQQGKRQAGTLKGRVLIGRWPDNTIVIDDRAVSRIHAWIGLQDGRYYVADAGSRTGTFVNGEALRERHVLYDGDQIRVGPAVLRYRTDPAPPPDDQPIDLSPRPAAELSGALGMFMDCVCGAPLWLPHGFAGIGQCRFCGHTVTRAPAAAARAVAAPTEPPTLIAPSRVPLAPADIGKNVPPTPPRMSPPMSPHASDDGDDFEAVMDDAFTHPATAQLTRQIPPAAPSPLLAARVPAAPRAVPQMPKSTGKIPIVSGPARPYIPPAAPSHKATATAKVESGQKCGVCHAPITVFDDVASCPSCGLIFHAECWQENLGCSAYGCAQVGALSGK